MKSHERFLKKTLKQHSAKHFKDSLSIRRNEAQHIAHSSRTQPQPNPRSVAYKIARATLVSVSHFVTSLFCPVSSSKAEVMDVDVEHISNLSHQHVLPVARGLIALILYNSANVDMFLLACKVNKHRTTLTLLILVLFVVKCNVYFILLTRYL